jgi:hypothetical protein
MQDFTDPHFFRDKIVSAAQLPFPSGGARVAWIDARDIAAVAERALLEQGHAGAVYELPGPAALSLPQTAELLSRATGHPVVHREATIDDAVAGLEGLERDLFALTFQRVQAGTFAEVTDLTGRPARTLEAFLADFGDILRRAKLMPGPHPGHRLSGLGHPSVNPEARTAWLGRPADAKAPRLGDHVNDLVLPCMSADKASPRLLRPGGPRTRRGPQARGEPPWASRNCSETYSPLIPCS